LARNEPSMSRWIADVVRLTLVATAAVMLLGLAFQ
jgi:hypothetical protein